MEANAILDRLTPPIPAESNGRPYATNDIIHRNIVVFGSQGSGKTELLRCLAEKLEEKYGEGHSTTILSRYFPRLISAVGAVKTPVQMYIWEDASLKQQKDDELSAFFNVRHIYAARTGIYKGVIITANVTHDLYAIKKKMRSSLDGIFFKSLPNDEFDKRAARNILGCICNLKNKHDSNCVYGQFEDRLKNNEKTTTAYNINGETGLLKWDLAKNNHIIDIDIDIEYRPVKTDPFGLTGKILVIGFLAFIILYLMLVFYVVFIYTAR